MRKVYVSTCYCHIPRKKLREFARLRFVEHTPAAVLTQQVQTKEEREYLSLVEMLDLGKEEFVQRICTNEPGLFSHLIHCHFQTRQTLRNLGFMIPQN